LIRAEPNTGFSVPDIAIIGGGIIGMLSAYELVESGAQVTIYDRQAVAQEASWAGGGILSPLYPWRYPDAVTRLARWSQQHYKALVSRLLETTGIDAQYLESGLLIYAPKEIKEASKWAEKHKIHLEVIEPAEAEILQPGIQPDAGSWIWMPEIAQVRNPRLLKALHAYLSLKNVNFVENEPISSIKTESGRIVGLQARDHVIPAERCLVASGAWSSDLLQLGVVEVEPVRGQMVLLKGDSSLLQRIVLKDSHYLIPRDDGRILVGSTLEYVGYDKTITSQARDELLNAAEGIYPGITSRCEVETQWAGLRPGSPEGIPYIGEHPEVSGFFSNSGHFRNGFALGLASARLGADLMLGRDPVLDPASYRLER